MGRNAIEGALNCESEKGPKESRRLNLRLPGEKKRKEENPAKRTFTLVY